MEYVSCHSHSNGSSKVKRNASYSIFLLSHRISFLIVVIIGSFEMTKVRYSEQNVWGATPEMVSNIHQKVIKINNIEKTSSQSKSNEFLIQFLASRTKSQQSLNMCWTCLKNPKKIVPVQPSKRHHQYLGVAHRADHIHIQAQLAHKRSATVPYNLSV